MPKNLLVLGDFLNEEDEQRGEPFAGYGGRLLRPIFRALDVEPSTLHWTNLFNISPSNGINTFAGEKNDALPGKAQLKAGPRGIWVHKRWASELQRLENEIERVNPNCILALGPVALWALYNSCAIKKYRGTALLSGSRKVIPTYAPLAILRQWKLRPILFADCRKALNESAFPELKRPRRVIYIEPTLADIRWFIEEKIRPAKKVSCDIETKKIGKHATITEVGFAPDKTCAMVIPFYCREKKNYWPTVEAEIKAWRLVAEILALRPQFGQNFNYDLTYFWKEMGIPVPWLSGDTMLLQHSLYPEMEKGLGFLASIHTSEPSWKFMRTDHDSYKDGD